MPALAGLPADDEDVRHVRREFLEVLESLDEDGFDLLAIAI